MPSLKKFLENTSPIELVRGDLIIKAKCYAERISWQDPEYAKRANKADELQSARQEVLQKHSAEIVTYHTMRAAFDSPEYLASLLDGGEEDAAPSSDAVATKSAQIQADMDALSKKAKAATAKFEKELEKVDQQIFANACDRAGYLLASWDFTEDEEGQKPLGTDADSLAKVFGQNHSVLFQLTALLDGAVFGPLVTAPDSTA